MLFRRVETSTAASCGAPPLFDYTHLIDEEYEKKREAVLTHFSGVVSRTTSYLDADMESQLINMYEGWTLEKLNAAWTIRDVEKVAFYDGLRREVGLDRHEASGEYPAFGFKLFRQGDGTYGIRILGEYWPSSSIRSVGREQSNDDEGSEIRSNAINQGLSSPESWLSEDEENLHPRQSGPYLLAHTSMRLPRPPPLVFLLRFATATTSQHSSGDSSETSGSSSDEDVD